MTDDAPLAPSETDAPEASKELVAGLHLSRFFTAPRGARRARLVRAVEHASLRVAAGESVGLVGESGSGKTTLGRLLLRLIEPNFGRVWFEGREITHHHERDLRALRRRMQMLFQDASASLDDRWSVADSIAEPLRIHGLGQRRDDASRVAALLAMVQLPSEIAERRPPELSSGECQRVCVARALASNPRFLVCDEPFGALDVREQLEVLDLFRSLQQERGHAYLFISHDLPLVARSCQRIYVMYAGRIVETGSADDVSARSRHPYTRALLNAVPELEPRRRRLRVILDGEPPSPFHPISGCPFHPRCPRAEPGLCENELPALTAAGPNPDHEFACWHPLT
jgi:oligopeptide transport system ATP-binding protein